MQKSQLQQIKRELKMQRDEAIRFMQRAEDEARALDADCPKDMGDLSCASFSKESLFYQSSEKTRLVKRIDAALKSIDEGSFGVCSICGEEINAKRLKALPWTSTCLSCQEQLEQRRNEASSDMAAVSV
ncbi:MAG TPA: TraR/DksA family transcriptional regulator [Terriglobales bacterium]|nr:TraR/DksA family transcriptional regulator [Terriglobales bacterium]